MLLDQGLGHALTQAVTTASSWSDDLHLLAWNTPSQLMLTTFLNCRSESTPRTAHKNPLAPRQSCGRADPHPTPAGQPGAPSLYSPSTEAAPSSCAPSMVTDLAQSGHM